MPATGDVVAPATAPVRVLHVIDGLGGGGIERWLWDIVRLSDQESYRYQVVTVQPDETGSAYVDRLRRHGAYDPPRRSPVLSFLGRAIDSAVVRVRRNPSPSRVYPGRLLQSYTLAFRRLIGSLHHFRPDLIHAHGFHAFAAALVVRRFSGVPLVHTVPSLFSQMVDAGFTWMPPLYARAHRWVDRFFTGASVDELVGRGIPRTKIELTEASVDLESVALADAARETHAAEIRRVLALSADARIALSVGRLHPSKGHQLTLEALPSLLARHPALHWVVLGEGDARCSLESRSVALGVQSHVHLIGFREDPLPYYAAADVYLRTPIFEAENFSSLNAMAMGLPVVGFDTGARTEHIPKVGHGVLVPKGDAASLADAVSRILSSPDLGRSMGHLGAAYSRTHLDIRQSVAQFTSAYLTVATSR